MRQSTRIATDEMKDWYDEAPTLVRVSTLESWDEYKNEMVENAKDAWLTEVK